MISKRKAGLFLTRPSQNTAATTSEPTQATFQANTWKPRRARL